MQYLFDIIIGSLIFVYDLLFTLIYRSFKNPALSIIVLSIVINFFVLPLYNKADTLQKDEQDKRKSMDLREKQIRKAFKKDEQFMMISAYYRICHYNPLSFLKEAVPLLLQIPFFIAAYQFISSLIILDGASFGPISNLIEPDRIIVIGTFSINLLPILMTLINLVSAAIYTKGSTIKLKIQILITALIFLVLLYNSPSGLVLYWTMNNIFSLAKNIVQTLSDKARMFVKVVIAFIILATAEALSIMARIQPELSEMLVIGSISYIIVTLGHTKIKEYFGKRFPFILNCPKPSEKATFAIVFLSELALVILLGLYIPSTVLLSSVVEFISPSTGLFNYELISYPVCIYAGLLLLWFTVVFFSYGDSVRRGIAVVLSSMLLFAIINQFVFAKSFGSLYPDLQFDEAVSFPVWLTIINALTGIIILIVCIIVFFKKPILLRYSATIIVMSLLLLSCRNIYLISRSIKKLNYEPVAEMNYNGILHLSRTGQNVIVFMLDRAISGYVPYIFDEKPELLESYRGFVYYPNTISFGLCTNYGAPALFGGYEYSPAAMNQRTTELLADKHDEALLLMPLLFSQVGYDVTVTDPPYAGYQSPPDLSIYDDYPQISAYNLTGVYDDDFVKELNHYDADVRQRRNFVMYSAFRTAPTVFRGFVYDDGKYIYNNVVNHYSMELIDNYSTLSQMSRLTSVDDSEQGSFLLLQNSLPHNPVSLDSPNYEIGFRGSQSFITDASEYYGNRIVNGRILEISDIVHWRHYCVNVVTYEQVAIWLDYLKEQGVYDNTRIILVADHGYGLSQFPNLITADGLDVENFTPLLMVKDFDSNAPFSVDYTFMTNADVPTLAMEGIIDNPINPFTGNPVNSDRKYDGPLFVTNSHNHRVDINNGNVFDAQDGRWYSIRDNLFDMNNWIPVSEEEVYG